MFLSTIFLSLYYIVLLTTPHTVTMLPTYFIQYLQGGICQRGAAPKPAIVEEL
jgi:hypothetical protein